MIKEEVLFHGPQCSQHEGSGGRIHIWWQEAEIGWTLNVAVFFPSFYSIQTHRPQMALPISLVVFLSSSVNPPYTVFLTHLGVCSEKILNTTRFHHVDTKTQLLNTS